MKRILQTLLLLLGGVVAPVRASQVGVFCYMAGNGSEMWEDEHVRAHLTVTLNGTALMEIENLTDSVLIINRSRSFAIVNGSSIQMFLPQSSTESHTHSRLRMEESAHWPETQWGVSESHTTSHTVYDQPILRIAPHQSSIVYTWEQLPQLLRSDIIRVGHRGGMFSRRSKGQFLDTGAKFRIGDGRQYTAAGTPLSLTADIEYCFSEAGDDAQRIRVSDYVKSISIDSHKTVSDKEESLHGSLPAGPCFAFRSGTSVGAVMGEWLAVAGLMAVIVWMEGLDDMPDMGHFSTFSR